jgi:glycosyltransferase involved in cell wall biosynthesis
MKLAYISNSSPTTRKAHGLQIAKMCEAFADEGVDLELILPHRSKEATKTRGDYFGFYGIKENFKLVKLPVIDLVKFGKPGFLITALSFGLSCRKYLRTRKFDAVYTRDPVSPFFLKESPGTLIYFEAHKALNRTLMKKLIRRVAGVVSITGNLAAELESLGVAGGKILVAPDGVDLEQFDLHIAQVEARKKLGLPDKKIILYSGNLKLAWKGVGTVVETAKSFGSDVLFVLIGTGGSEEYNSENVYVAGYKPHKEVPLWLKAANILLLPNTAKEGTSKLYTSPLKMFEYMASKRPIIASDLPSIREVLSEKNAVLVGPDDPKSLAEGIEKILKDPGLVENLSVQAFEDVQNYTWRKRARRILDFIK